VAKVIIGQEAAVELALVTLLTRNHALIEGVPGVAKTLLVRTLGHVLGVTSGRVQFTPDLMPADILGSEVLDEDEHGRRSFRFVPGPVFCQLLMADEINRASPRTQSALLQAMQEGRVAVGGVEHPLPRPFHVLATQNPIEQEGTYPLPEAQLDRFLFKHVLDYPSLEEERAIVAGHGNRAGTATPDRWGITAQTDAAELAAASATVAGLVLVDEVIDYVEALVRATRTSPDLSSGASPRAAVMLAGAARAAAALDGRDYVVPDDVKRLAPDVLRHRIILSPAAEIDGRAVDQILAGLIDATAAPR
jgi:MoxR-like ATPase